MESISLREFQLELLNLLEIIHEVCSKYEIPYWIDGGTLIGAVRHQGFIPWDDDLDICLLKSDYDRLLPLLMEYTAEHTDFTLMYNNLGALTNWCEYLGNLRVVVKKPFGKGFFPCHIDIIPVKAVKNSEHDILEDRRITDLSNYYYRGDIKYPDLLDVSFVSDKKQAISAKKQFAAVFDAHLNKNMEQLGDDVLLNYAFGDSLVTKQRDYYRYTDVFPLKQYVFEGKYFWGPNNHDSYLKKLYTNYMQLPALQNQVPYFLGYYRSNKNFDKRKLVKILNAQYIFFYEKNSLMYAVKRSFSYLIRFDFSLIKKTVRQILMVKAKSK